MRIVPVLMLVGIGALARAQTQQFVISTYAGGGLPATIPVAGGNAAIGPPQGVTTDASGNVYFISSYYGVFKLDRNGVLTRIAGNGGGYSGDGGPAINAQFNLGSFDDESGIPGIAVDSAGDVYIADTGNNRVRKISSAGIITTVAGNGTPGQSGDGGPATNAQLTCPAGLAVDRAGNLYIADRNSIRKVSADGNITTVTAAADGSAIAVDSAGNLYIGSGGAIRKIAPNGAITTVAAENPSAMTVDSAGNIYLAEGGLVRMITPDGMVATVAGNGTCGYSGDGGPATSSQLCATALAVDSEGSLYITEAANQRVRKISPPGVINTVAGNGTCCYSGDGGPALGAQLNFAPWGGGMAADSGGNLYIADSANQRVRKISASGTITAVAGSGISGGYSGDGGPAISAQLNDPSGVAVDSAGNLYIADVGNHRIRKVSASGTITTAAPQAGSRALAVDRADNIYYFPDGGGIGKISPSGIITTVTNAQLNLPFAIAVDTAGNLFFVEIGYIAGVPNYRVRKLSPDGNITVVAGGDGTPGFSGDGGPAPNAHLNGPAALAVDGAGNLYIADSFNARIRMVSSGGIITTVAGNPGNPLGGNSGDGGPATDAQFGYLSGLTVDGAGNLYAADQSYNTIRLLQPVSSSTVVSGVTNAASNLTGAIAPGELIAVTGSGLGPAQLVSAVPGSDGLYAAQLAGTTVQINGTPALLIYTSATEVAAVVPDSVSGGTAQVTVAYQGRISASFPVPVAATAPGIFTQDGTGQGHAATINQKGLVNVAAGGGDVVTLFLTGTGHATPAVAINNGQSLPIVQGPAPGVMQFKMPIPTGEDCDEPVVFQVGSAMTQPGVTIAIDICI